MKNFKIMLSVLMVLIIISVSVVSVFATTNTVLPSKSVISEELAAMMEKYDDDEKITVYLWYKDIDQDEVDMLTTKATGLTRESCEVVGEFPSTELLASLEKGETDAQKQMEKYMASTKKDREAERNLTDLYAKKHREIANQKYIQKSNNIRKTLSISDSEIVFSSQFTPLIIADMTAKEIEKASKNSEIDEISLYHELEFRDPSVDTDEGVYAKEAMGLNDVYGVYGLTGEGVDVGLIESNIPGPVILEVDGTTVLEELEIDLDDVTIVEAERHKITPDIHTPSSKHSHSYNTFRVMAGCQTGIAKNINMYATNTDMVNVEEMLKMETGSGKVIDVLEYNGSTWVRDYKYNNYYLENSRGNINDQFAYHPLEKYYDYLVANHNIITVVAGGNSGSHEFDYFGRDYLGEGNYSDPYWHPGARVTSPGLAYNVITVGGYNCNNNLIDTDDFLVNYCWKDSFQDMNGCEKPDVIMPMNFPGGGTSVSSPALTAQIALMLELKPSLSLYPQAVKAIVLASCHRKVVQTSEQGGQETIEQGITERQGAGAPDAWTMASIICQGTYGIGTLGGSSISFNIVQPSYSADNLNVSISWTRENTDMNSEELDTGYNDILEGQASNIDLSVYRGDTIVGTSELDYSSTEMCYVPLSTTDNKYKITLTQESTITPVRFGYAWSTDNMRAAPVSDDGIYYVSNKANGRYMTYSETENSQQAVQRAVSTQAAFSDIHTWVFKKAGDAYNVLPGGATSSLHLGVSSTMSGTSNKSELTSVATPLNLLYNSDGTYSILNSSNNKILSYSGSNLVWNTFDSVNSTPSTAQRWYFSKVNYIVGDADTDGYMTVLDQTFVQFYLAELNTPNNMQLYLSDADRNGVVNILDARKINRIFSDLDLY
ncbi:MAG: hypothetical protein E7513_06925 [Ruminococcaceae bacterium]|nr:hypothetical protein [Oscillospiraceae bacterium]